MNRMVTVRRAASSPESDRAEMIAQSSEAMRSLKAITVLDDVLPELVQLVKYNGYPAMIMHVRGTIRLYYLATDFPAVELGVPPGKRAYLTIKETD